MSVYELPFHAFNDIYNVVFIISLSITLKSKSHWHLKDLRNVY